MPSVDIYAEHSGLGRPIAWSAGLHLAFAVLVTLYAIFVPRFRGSGWGGGGGGDAMGATLVTSVPLPAPTTQTANVLATESKGLSQSQPKVEEKEPEAIPIPDKNTKVKPPKKPLTATQRKTQPEPEESNQVPYGEGGPASGPYSMMAGTGQSGLASTGSGDFAGRFPWYVQAMARKITENRQAVDSRVTE